MTRSGSGWCQALVALVVVCGAVPAAAQGGPCTRHILTLPANITAPGHYCLARNLSTAAGVAVSIQADDVTLDLRDFTISSTAPPTEITNGVFADSRRNVTVRNGTLRGFYGGVLLAGSLIAGRASNNVVEDLRVQDSGFFGIQMDGFHSLVRRCTVTDTGGSPLTGTTGGNAFGILLFKGATQALDNSVLNFYPDGGGTAYGIRVGGGNFLLAGNHVEGGTTGPQVGIRMDSSEAGYRDNVVWRVTTPYVGGIDLGNNASF